MRVGSAVVGAVSHFSDKNRDVAKVGHPMLLRALHWCTSVLVFVSVGEAERMALLSYETVALAIHSAASGTSTVSSVLASAGLRNPLDILRLT
jgi:hypothetical protein